MSDYIGIVSAEPRYRFRCWLRRHERRVYLVGNGLRVPWCFTCRQERP